MNKKNTWVYQPPKNICKTPVLYHGEFEILLRDPDGAIVVHDNADNLITTEGRNHHLNVVYNGATQVATWYIGVFEGNYTPLATDTAATFPSAATECTAYDEATRQAFVEATSTAGLITNTASRAVFTFNATKTIYGGFLTSASAKSATTGVLMAAARFSPSRNVEAAFQLTLGYNVTLIDA